jgi:2-methylisocitrate lyase-like PEP mutase family enzyme
LVSGPRSGLRITLLEGDVITPPDRLRALLAEPSFVVMPAVWDGLSAKLSAAAGFKTAFLSGSCVAASRLGGPDLDLISFGEMFDSFNMVHGAAPETLVLADGDHGYGVFRRAILTYPSGV